MVDLNVLHNNNNLHYLKRHGTEVSLSIIINEYTFSPIVFVPVVSRLIGVLIRSLHGININISKLMPISISNGQIYVWKPRYCKALPKPWYMPNSRGPQRFRANRRFFKPPLSYC